MCLNLKLFRVLIWLSDDHRIIRSTVRRILAKDIEGNLWEKMRDYEESSPLFGKGNMMIG